MMQPPSQQCLSPRIFCWSYTFILVFLLKLPMEFEGEQSPRHATIVSKSGFILLSMAAARVAFLFDLAVSKKSWPGNRRPTLQILFCPHPIQAHNSSGLSFKCTLFRKLIYGICMLLECFGLFQNNVVVINIHIIFPIFTVFMLGKQSRQTTQQ